MLIGALMGYFAHPYWLALHAVVGAGLVFAGITDACGMGMLLARVSLNQVGNHTTSAAVGVLSRGPLRRMLGDW